MKFVESQKFAFPKALIFLLEIEENSFEIASYEA
jgi:hypothetical protein